MSNTLYYFKGNTYLPPEKRNGYQKQKHQKVKNKTFGQLSLFTVGWRS